MLRHVLSLASVCAVSSSALAAAFTYNVQAFPPTGDCHAVAASLSQRFSQLTRVAASARCERVTAAGYDLSVRYEAEQPLPLVSTVGSDVGADSELGAYASRQQCEAELVEEQARFQEQTGLQPLVAYCYPSSFLDAYPFVLRVDAFGTAAKAPVTQWLSFSGRVADGGASALEATVAQALEARGYALSFTRAVSEQGLGLLGLGYYAAEATRLEAKEWAKLPDAASCAAAVGHLATGFTAFASAPLATFCAQHDVFAGYTVVNVASQDTGIEATKAIETYGSYAACEADRARVLTYYRDTLGRSVAGALCSAGKDDIITLRGWHVVLVERP